MKMKMQIRCACADEMPFKKGTPASPNHPCGERRQRFHLGEHQKRTGEGAKSPTSGNLLAAEPGEKRLTGRLNLSFSLGLAREESPSPRENRNRNPNPNPNPNPNSHENVRALPASASPRPLHGWLLPTALFSTRFSPTTPWIQAARWRLLEPECI